MKKIVCEVCGSQKIRKDKGFFSCLECGTEYSLEEIKNLLVEADTNKCEDASNNIQPLTVNNDIDLLKDKLLMWANLIISIDTLRFFLDVPHCSDYNLWSVDTCKSLLKIKTTGKVYKYDSYYTIDFKLGFHSDMAKSEFTIQFLIDCEKAYKSMEEKLEEEKYNFYGRTNLPGYKEYINGYENGLKHLEGVKKDSDFILSSNFFNNFIKDIFQEKICYDNAPNLIKSSHVFADKYKNYEHDYKRYYEKQILPLVDESKDFLYSLIEIANLLEAEFNLPFKYRDSNIIIKMIELIENGNATTWKELVNLYDTHEFRENVIFSLDVLTQKLDYISSVLFNISDQISSVNNNLSVISSKLTLLNKSSDNLLKDIKKIRKYTFGILWNTL